MGYGSRKDIQTLARAARISLDGIPLKESDQRITITPDLPTRMQVDGEALDPLPGLTLLLHKPVGVTCSHKEAGPLVYSLLPDRWRLREPALCTIGRLDKATAGLLMITDDGGVLHRVISPKSHVSKRYQVALARPLHGDEAEIFASGRLMLEGEKSPLHPVKFESASPLTATVILTEGRYHQVRRMFAAVGNHVEALHRDRIGGLDLPTDLAPGEFRILGDLSPIFSG